VFLTSERQASLHGGIRCQHRSDRSELICTEVLRG